MTHDEKGYIQFQCEWEPANPPAVPAVLIEWRDRLRALGLIGVYPDGIGFGNVSVRSTSPLVGEVGERSSPGGGMPTETPHPPLRGDLPHKGGGEHRFLISGTATGQLASLGPEHFAEVRAFDIDANWLRCRGRVQASSESLSHAALYVADPAANAVIHVHHLGLWEANRGRLPTTDPAAEAGTPAMARAIAELLRDPDVRADGVFVMGGHREGLMAFGATVEEAGERLFVLKPLAASQ